jgi:sporulation-control protein
VVFKKMLAALGVGGPDVDTVLANPSTRPGLNLEGQIHLRGGDHAVDLKEITLGLQTRMEVERDDKEYETTVELGRVAVTGAVHLDRGQQLSVPFAFPVPWETPITDVFGQRLRRMTMGLRTKLAVVGAVDEGDLDPIGVHPLPAQERVLEAFSRLGFHFRGADVEKGRIRGANQTLPCYQEFEFHAAPAYARRAKAVEVTFVANPGAVQVIVEIDKRGGLFMPSHDVYLRFEVPHNDSTTDWAAYVDSWLRSTLG